MDHKRRRLFMSSSLESDVSEWEDVPDFLVPIVEPEPRPDHKVQKLRRVSLQYLLILCYTVNLYHRNRWLESKSLHKRLRGLAPKPLKKRARELSSVPSDELVVYVLKYAVKWFRRNYKLDSCGLRVLGYLGDQDPSKCYPQTASPISSLQDLKHIAKTFQHNRDTGALLFTALLRALGFEARIVMSLPLLSTKHDKKQPEFDREAVRRNKDNDLLYPYYWTEAVNPADPSQVFCVESTCFDDESKFVTRLQRFGPGTAHTDIFSPKPDQLNKMPPMRYVVAFDKVLLDVSPRYMRNVGYRYFKRLDLYTDVGKTALLVQTMIRSFNKSVEYDDATLKELDHLRNSALASFDVPTSFAAMKRSPNLVTPSTLRYNEVIDPRAVRVGLVKLKHHAEPVYSKTDTLAGKSVLQWKSLGRSVKREEIDKPIKTIRVSPRTIYRRRLAVEDPDLTRTNIYSFAQTCPYVKEEVREENGRKVLPRNRYGNIEVFRPWMVPDGTTWIRLSDCEKIFRRYATFEYVPVVVGFDFRSKVGTAIPQKHGVIVLEEDEVLAKKVWLAGKMVLHKEESNRRTAVQLAAWQRLLRMLRIKRRVDGYALE